MKVVINACYGGFSISKRAAEYMAERGHEAAKRELAEWERSNGWVKAFLKTGEWPAEAPEIMRGILAIAAKYHGQANFYGYFECDRHEPLLIEAIEALGAKEAGGEHSKLKIVEIPDGTSYVIEEYDGSEHIAEQHRTWS